MKRDFIGGVIDVGTNSVKCLVAKAHALERMETLLYTRTISKLGTGLERNGILLDESMERTVSIIEDYVKQIKTMQADEIVIFGTYALRIAENTGVFIKMIKDRTGIDVEILSGDEEAEYTTLGALLDIDECTPAKITVIDIGGGSTEVAGDDYMKSLPMGALSVSERFLVSDPPSQQEMEEASEFLLNLFSENLVQLKEKNLVRGVGVGGTIMSAAALKKKLDTFDFEKLHLTELTVYELQLFIERLSQVTIEQRRLLLPFDPDRAEIIVGGLLILRTFFDYFKVDRFTVSLKNLIHGVFYKKFLHRVQSISEK
jgi:exopolyphosphatase / guanosine-5'-triphosphate,3'-diphosphate pyrophosphatase